MKSRLIKNSASFTTLLLALLPLTVSAYIHQWPHAEYRDDKFEYIDTHGNVVIPAQFASAGSFNNGYAQCHDYSKEPGDVDWKNIVFIDKSGNRLVMPTNGYGPASSTDKLFDEYTVQGKKIIQHQYYDIWSRKKKLSLVKYRDGFCVCDATLNIIKKFPIGWQPQGQNPTTGNDWFQCGSKAYEFTGALNKSEMPGCEPIVPPMDFSKHYAYVDGFYDGLAAVMTFDKQWQYIDGNGAVRIKLPTDCCNAHRFNEGLAAVSLGGRPWPANSSDMGTAAKRGAKFGFINKSGSFVIPAQYPCLVQSGQSDMEFKDGLSEATAIVNGDIAYGFIDRSGHFVVPPIYASVSPFSQGLSAVNAKPVGFDKLSWHPPNYDGQSGWNRTGECLKFLRQYHLLGMPTNELFWLLGPPEPLDAQAHYILKSPMLAWNIETSCMFRFYLLVETKDGKVEKYTIGQINRPVSKWITSNAQPEFEESVFEFVARAAQPVK